MHVYNEDTKPRNRFCDELTFVSLYLLATFVIAPSIY